MFSDEHYCARAAAKQPPTRCSPVMDQRVGGLVPVSTRPGTVNRYELSGGT